MSDCGAMEDKLQECVRRFPITNCLTNLKPEQQEAVEWAIPFNIRTPPVEEQWNSSGVRVLGSRISSGVRVLGGGISSGVRVLGGRISSGVQGLGCWEAGFLQGLGVGRQEFFKDKERIELN